MSVISRKSVVEQVDGLPHLTADKLYVVECDTCGERKEVVSASGLWWGSMEPYGMTALLYPEGVKHSCLEHLK